MIRGADINDDGAAALDVVGLVVAVLAIGGFRDSGATALAEDQVGINGLDHIAGFGRKIDVLAVIEGLGIGDLSVAVGARVPVTRIVARAGGTLVGFHGDISINGGTCISIRDNLDSNRTSHRILDRRLRQRYGDIVRRSFQNIARGAGNALDIVGSAVRTGQRRVNLGQIRSKFGALADLYPLVCNWARNLNWSTLSILVRNRQCCGVKDRCRNRECDFLIPTAILIIQSRLVIQRNRVCARLDRVVLDLNGIFQSYFTIQTICIGPVDGIAGHCGVRLARCRYLQRAIHQFDTFTQRVADQALNILADRLHADFQLAGVSRLKVIVTMRLAGNVFEVLAAESKSNGINLTAVLLELAEIGRPFPSPRKFCISRVAVIAITVADDNHHLVGIILGELGQRIINASLQMRSALRDSYII